MKSVPLVCPRCSASGSYYGRLVFGSDPTPATCPHHPGVALVTPDIRTSPSDAIQGNRASVK